MSEHMSNHAGDLTLGIAKTIGGVLAPIVNALAQGGNEERRALVQIVVQKLPKQMIRVKLPCRFHWTTVPLRVPLVRRMKLKIRWWSPLRRMVTPRKSLTLPPSLIRPPVIKPTRRRVKIFVKRRLATPPCFLISLLTPPYSLDLPRNSTRKSAW